MTTRIDRDTLVAVAKLLRYPKRPLVARLTDGKRAVELPLSHAALRLLLEALAMSADGRTPMLVAGDEELTTQEAADLLGVSRPTIVKLLDQGELRGRRVGARRRVRASAVAAYQARRDEVKRYVDELLAAAPPYAPKKS